MSNNRKIITVRVSDKTYNKFKVKCAQEKRSMSAQGELLIDDYVTDFVTDSKKNKTLDEIRRAIGEI